MRKSDQIIISQVGKRGLPPLSVLYYLTQGKSGGKPPFPT